MISTVFGVTDTFCFFVGENVQGEMIRIRVDLAGSGASADVAVGTSLPVATVIPELLALFPVDSLESACAKNAPHRTIPAWRLRLSSGEVADGESSLGSMGIRNGDRITLIDDPGPIPAPRVMDIADALSDSTPGVGIADRVIGVTLALVSSLLVAVALVHMSETDYVLASAGAFLLMLLSVAGLRISINRGHDSSVIWVLVLQVLGFSTVTGICFVGAPLAQSLTDWRPLAGAAISLAASGVTLSYLGRHVHDSRPLLLLGSAGWSMALGIATYSCGLHFLGAQSAVAVSAVFCIIALMAAPALSVSLAGIRVPHIPAAGESFEDSDDPHSDSHTDLALRSSLLLDGTLLGILSALAMFGSSLVAMDFESDNAWALAMAVCVAILCAVQSRGHARVIPSMTSAFVAGAIALTICWKQWMEGVWVVALLIALPMCAAIMLPTVPSTRISPTVRRAMEFVEAIAIAISLPLAAIVIDLPEIVQGLMK